MNNDYLNWLKTNTDSANTLHKYAYEITAFFKIYPEFNQDNVNEYLSNRIDQISKSTFNLILSALKSYNRFSKIEIEFPKQKKINKVFKEYYTEEDFRSQVLTHVQKNFSRGRFYCFILKLMFYTGLRAEELITLRKEHINFKEKKILVTNTKSKKDREVFSINDDFFKELEQYTQNKTDNLFDFDYDQLYYLFRKFNEGSGLPFKLHPHLMRTCYAKHCLRKKIDISIIQKLMGHTDIKTTLQYAEPDRKIIQEACEEARKRE